MLWKNVELSIMYLLSQDTLVAKKPTIKCDIIEAKNALKLHESDVKYFYKPDIITKEIIDDIDYYKMIFKIQSDYEIPLMQEFKFTEYCFENNWSLRWNGKVWEGENCKGCIHGKVLSKLNRLNTKRNSAGATGCLIMIKNNDINRGIIPAHENGLMYSLFQISSLRTEITYTHRDDIESGTLYDIKWEVDHDINGNKYDGYDLANIYCSFGNLSSGKFNYFKH